METVKAQKIILPDGRTLGFAEYGQPKGRPVFFFHGTPGSHLDWELVGDEATACRLGIRLIAVDRPGMGESDFLPGRRFLDWPDDVTSLADALGLECFSVLGYSSGGAYALACALKIPERLQRVTVVSGDGPYYMPGLTEGLGAFELRGLHLSHSAPWLYQLVLRSFGWSARFFSSIFMAGFRASLLQADLLVSQLPDFSRRLRATMLEALHQGPRGPQWDTAVMMGAWDFHPQDITFPVSLWYGKADKSTSPAMGIYFSHTIPYNMAYFFSGEGHISLIHNYLDRILLSLVGPNSDDEMVVNMGA